MKKLKCIRCTILTSNATRVCDICTEISNRPKKCPKCEGDMELRTGCLGEFWGCLLFPECNGTITARGTYMRKFSE